MSSIFGILDGQNPVKRKPITCVSRVNGVHECMLLLHCMELQCQAQARLRPLLPPNAASGVLRSQSQAKRAPLACMNAAGLQRSCDIRVARAAAGISQHPSKGFALLVVCCAVLQPRPGCLCGHCGTARAELDCLRQARSGHLCEDAWDVTWH